MIGRKDLKDLETTPPLSDLPPGNLTVRYYITELLVKVGKADLNLKDSMGFPPVKHAVSFNTLDVVKALVRCGATLTWRVQVDTKVLQSTEALFYKQFITTQAQMPTTSKDDAVSRKTTADEKSKQIVEMTGFDVPSNMPEIQIYLNAVKQSGSDPESRAEFTKQDCRAFPAVLLRRLHHYSWSSSGISDEKARALKLTASMRKELFNTVTSDAKMEVKVRRLKELLKYATAEDVNAYHDVKDIWTGEVTILHIAAALGQTEILEILVRDEKTNLEARTTRNDRTALHVAAGFDQLEACKLLVKYIDPLIKTTTFKTAFRIAKEKVGLKRTPEQIARAKAVMDFLKVPTFVKACYAGDLELVTTMVTEEQVDVNGKSYDLGRTTGETTETWGLLGACWNGHIDVVEYLLTLVPKLNVNVRDERGYTILHVISRKSINNFPENVPQLTDCSIESPTVPYYLTEMLIKVGKANPDIKDNEGFPAMYYAIGFNSLDVVKALVRSGADISWRVTLDPKKAFTSQKDYHEKMKSYNRRILKDPDFGPELAKSKIDLNTLTFNYQEAIQIPVCATYLDMPLGMPEMRRYMQMVKQFGIGEELTQNFHKLNNDFFPKVRERALMPRRPEPLISKLHDVTGREFKINTEPRETSKLVY
jgi:ankyrin repeat protein